MMKSVLAFAMLFCVLVSCQTTRVQIQMANEDEINGASLTPLWVVFHDGSYDPFNVGSSASAMIESIAEDGSTELLANAISTSSWVYGTIVADNSDVPVVTFGQTATAEFDINPSVHRYVTFISMLVPSNDAFFGNDNPTAYSLFDDDEFNQFEILWEGSNVYDAGTEVNDEVPTNTAFWMQTTPNTGVTENSVIGKHPGLNAAGTGGIVDQPQFANAQFDDDDDVIGSITVREVSVTSDDDDDDASPVSFSPVSVSPVSFSPVSSSSSSSGSSSSSSSSGSSSRSSSSGSSSSGDDDDDSSSASVIVLSVMFVFALLI